MTLASDISFVNEKSKPPFPLSDGAFSRIAAEIKALTT
jgi:hypothetical protein